ncbi:MAG: hypothetical protein WCJ02_16100 [bacterium]
MDFFNKKNPAEKQPTAVEYVEWMLKYMVRTSRTELVIDTRRVVPGSISADQLDGPPCIPDACAVVNRLKILAGINPMSKQPSSTGTVFQRPRTHDTVYVSTQFQDHAEKTLCTIRLNIRNNNV